MSEQNVTLTMTAYGTNQMMDFDWLSNIDHSIPILD